MYFKPKFQFSRETPPPEERLDPQDEQKFGFSMPLRNNRDRKLSFDLTSKLPKLRGGAQNIENDMRKDRLHSLKNKFGKMLNLTEFESRETSPSMCQYTTRRRGLSEIIENHSKSKERLISSSFSWSPP